MAHPIHEVIGPLTKTLSQKYPSKGSEHAFIRWYAEVRFGKNGHGGCSHMLVDGAGDLGVDYVIETQVGYIVIQSKFSASPKLLDGHVPNSQLRHFAKVVDHLSSNTNVEDFGVWLSGTKQSKNQALYRNIRKASADGRLVRFIFATTRHCDKANTWSFQIDARDEIFHLWSLFEEGLTAPFDELWLDVKALTSHQLPSARLYSGVGRVDQLLKAMHDAKSSGSSAARLFDQNVRSYMGGTETNKRLAKSYRTSPDLFFAKHNGIYIVAQKATVASDQKHVHLKFPSIINGAQTLWSLYHTARAEQSSQAQVFIRILETADRRLRDAVIAATNTQNAMSPSALLAHHDSLPEIARRLDSCHVYVERQQKAWNNHFKSSLQDHTPVNVKELIQWTRASQGSSHLGKLRSAVGKYLTEDGASESLSPLVARTTGKESARLMVSVAAGLLVKKVPARMKETVRGKGANGLALRLKTESRIASLLLVHIFSNGIGFTEKSRQRAEHALSEKHYRKVPMSLLLVVRMLMEAARAACDAHDMDFSNFFKRDDLIAGFIHKHLTPKMKKRIREEMLSWMHSNP